jgi:hypothetical protein
LTLRLGWSDQSAEEPHQGEEGLAETHQLLPHWSAGFDDDFLQEIEEMEDLTFQVVE